VAKQKVPDGVFLTRSRTAREGLRGVVAATFPTRDQHLGLAALKRGSELHDLRPGPNAVAS
jgi:hypothetical protein